LSINEKLHLQRRTKKPSYSKPAAQMEELDQFNLNLLSKRHVSRRSMKGYSADYFSDIQIDNSSAVQKQPQFGWFV
jgi:hypothetical protein